MGIVFSTASELITHALEELGVYGPSDAPSAEDTDFCMKRLNLLLDELGIVRGNIYVRTQDSKVLTVNDGEYSIGESGTPDWSTARPIKIEHAFLRDSTDYDTPLDCTMTEAEYNAITDKTVQGARPSRLWYNPTYPNGTITLDRLPDQAYTLHIRSTKPFTKFTDPGDTLAFPDGYESMFVYNLAVRAAAAFKKTPTQAQLALAAETANNVKNVNLEIPAFQFDVPTSRGGNGNILDFGQ